MARPKKNTIDYFPHPVKDGSRMYIMEQKYGDKGYCCYYKLLQQLGGSENHYLDFNGIKDRLFFAALIRATEEEMCTMLDTLSEIGTIDTELWNNKIIWCQELVDSICDVYTKRGRKLPIKPVSGANNPTSDVVTSDENPQSKVKETIVKETKVNNSKNNEIVYLFRIKGVVFNEKISEYIKREKSIFLDTWTMQNGKEKVPPIFEKIDVEYNGYDFNNENHIQNTFKSINDDIEKSKLYKSNGKSTKPSSATIIAPGKKWDD